jgi:hypothetical protein
MIEGVVLQELRCNQGKRSGAVRPYLWTQLLQIDDDTLASAVGVVRIDAPPTPDGAQVPFATTMLTGDVVVVPNAMSHLASRFRDGLSRRDLIVVAVLWDERDSPSNVVVAGYNAFLDVVRDAVADNLTALAGDGRDAAIQAISDRVNSTIHAAIFNEFTDLQKIEIFFGQLEPDRVIDSTFLFLENDVVTHTISLAFHAKPPETDNFQLDGQLVVSDDPCESELVAIRETQTAIANIRGRLKQLENGQGGNPAEREKEIEALLEQVEAQEEKLAAEQAALAQCQQQTGGSPPGPAQSALSMAH